MGWAARFGLAAALVVAICIVLAGPVLISRISGVDPKNVAADDTAPWSGNPNGDVVVAYFDYNCGYCKQTHKSLSDAVVADGNAKILYKDWPFLEDTSTVAAKMAIASAYQQRYLEAHDAIMAIRGPLTDERLAAALAAKGIDLDRLRADLAAHATDISRRLARNTVEAAALGLRGTPAYLVGPVLIGVRDREGYLRAIRSVRAESLRPSTEQR